jgi:hypothetical protein
MSVHTMRLIVGLFFLVAAAFLFAHRWLAPGLDAHFGSLTIAAIFALVFGISNVVRWYLAWSFRRTRATPVRTPLKPDPSLVRPEPPNPELDFTKSEEKTG